LGLSYSLFKQFALLTIPFFLLPNIFPHSYFIPSYCAYPISGRPKMQTHHSSLLQQLSMYSYCALPFQKSNRICHAIFRRYAQAQVYMVIHRVPFQQPNALLFAKLSQDLAYCCPKSPKYYLLSIFRYEHHVILALPTHMRQTFKVFHTLFLLPIRAFPGGRAYPIQTARRNGLACQGRTAIGRGFRRN
jgi:hypothetical protein